MSEDELSILKKQVAEIYDAILGDFKNEGLITRVVKLESSLKTAIGGLKVVGSVVIALIIGYLKMLMGL